MQGMTTTHEQCCEDITWLVNGRLGEVEQERLLLHVASCAECHDELQRQRELHAHLQAAPVEMDVSEASWNKLLARLEAQPQDSLALADTVAGTAPRRPRRWWVAAVWAQGAAIAVLLAALLVPQHAAEYVTLSNAATPPASGSIRVVFAPDASLARVNQLLREIEGEIIGGPSEAGVYTLAVAAGDDPSAAIRALRQHGEVLFAESTAAAGARRQ